MDNIHKNTNIEINETTNYYSHKILELKKILKVAWKDMKQNIGKNMRQATGFIQLISSFFNCNKIKFYNYTAQFYQF